MLDPEAPLRQAQWDAAIATLRQIDPANPNLVHRRILKIHLVTAD
jgi:hypothetical protein